MIYLLAAFLPVALGFTITSDTESFTGTVSLDDGKDVEIPEGGVDMEMYGLGGGYHGLSPVEMVRYDLLDWMRVMVAHEEYPGDTYGSLIRLAFHDAGTYDKYRGTGGAHGCIAFACGPNEQCEYNSPHHTGLPYIIDELNRLYDHRGYHYVLSRADWIHFAGFLAVKLSAPLYTEELYFRFGRTDCPHPQPYFGNMPDSEEDSFDYYYSFFNNYGMNERDMIALLGAHSVGRLEYHNMGYEGPWTYKQDIFDNEYYQHLYDPNFHWKRVTLDNRVWGDRHFFTSGAESPIPYRSMLYVDMSMFWDISDGVCEIGTYNSYGGHGYDHGYGYDRNDHYNHDFSYSNNYHYENANLDTEMSYMNYAHECPKTHYWGLLELYAHDNYAWMHDFNIAFMKLQELGLDHAYGKGLGYHQGGDYDGYGGYGQNNDKTWGAWGGDYATWGGGDYDADAHSSGHHDDDTAMHYDDNSYTSSDDDDGHHDDHYNSGYNSDYATWGSSDYNADTHSSGHHSGYNSGYSSDSGYNSGYSSDSHSQYGHDSGNYYRSANDVYGHGNHGYSNSGYNSGYSNNDYNSGYSNNDYNSGYGNNDYNSGYGSNNHYNSGYGSNNHYNSGYGSNNHYGGYGNNHYGGYGSYDSDSWGSDDYDSDSWGHDDYDSDSWGSDDYDSDSWGHDSYGYGGYGSNHYGGYGNNHYGGYGGYGGYSNNNHYGGYGNNNYGGYGGYGNNNYGGYGGYSNNNHYGGYGGYSNNNHYGGYGNYGYGDY